MQGKGGTAMSDREQSRHLVSGPTRLVGVMGWPVSHSRSPGMHNAALSAAGIDAVYVPLPVSPDRLAEAVAGLKALGFVGSNVTIPHKEGVAALMDELTEEARLIGAVNTIRVEPDGSLTGHNTDCIGAVAALERDGTSIRGKTTIIIGAGGAGRGVAAGCALAGAARVVVLNRTADRARAVVEELAGHSRLSAGTEWHHGTLGSALPGGLNWTDVDAVFQMTSLGMKDNREIPLDPAILPPGCHVLEGVYVPLETPFLSAARAKGLRTTDGLAMLLEQGAASFAFWFGVAPDREAMRRALSPAG